MFASQVKWVCVLSVMVVEGLEALEKDQRREQGQWFCEK